MTVITNQGSVNSCSKRQLVEDVLLCRQLLSVVEVVAPLGGWYLVLGLCGAGQRVRWHLDFVPDDAEAESDHPVVRGLGQKHGIALVC